MEAVSSFSEELFRSSFSPCLKRGCCRRYHNAFWARNWLECHQHRFLLSRCLTHYNKKSKLQQKSGCGLTIDNLRSLWTSENADVNILTQPVVCVIEITASIFFLLYRSTRPLLTSLISVTEKFSRPRLEREDFFTKQLADWYLRILKVHFWSE